MPKASAAWRRKRSEILGRDGNSCALCGTANVKLNVHHRYYESGKRPSDYPNGTLQALCDRCHGEADELRRILARASGWLDYADTERAIGYMEALAAEELGQLESASLLVRSHEHARGIADLFGITPSQVIAIGLKHGKRPIDVEAFRAIAARKVR